MPESPERQTFCTQRRTVTGILQAAPKNTPAEIPHHSRLTSSCDHARGCAEGAREADNQEIQGR